MASNEAVENAVSKLYYLQIISIGICTFLNEHFQLVQFHLKLGLFMFFFFLGLNITPFVIANVGRIICCF